MSWNDLSTKARERVRRAIEREETCCWDVCAEHGQIFDNVKEMQWFHEAVALELGLMEE